MNKPKVAVVSLFRDSNIWHGHEIRQVDRYIKQMKEQTYGFDNLNLYLVEGNSTDGTFETLRDYSLLYKNIQVEIFNNPYHAVESTTDPDRLRFLSMVGNHALSMVQGEDYILFIESDLIIKKDLIEILVKNLEENPEIGIIAPYTFYESVDGFYDKWAFRFEGRAFHPYYKEYKELGTIFPHMESIGSCGLMRRNAFKGVNFGQGCFPELCHRIKRKGYKVACNTELAVYHPSTMYVAKRLI